MRRRSPPTALRLATGPIPPRSHPKHVLPALPAPTFQLYAPSYAHSYAAPVRSSPSHTRFPSGEVQLPFVPTHVRVPTSELPRSGSSSPTSASSSGGVTRGPWDHSSLSLGFSVEGVLAPLKRAALAVSSTW
ncbi:hypothetical protein HWV62_23985 [Athelia sp. TMB]|nr:hypothetical protein HWV62_23985 [Athelia sp. TMB]